MGNVCWTKQSWFEVWLQCVRTCKGIWRCFRRELIEDDDAVEEQNDDVDLEDGVMPPEYSDESEAEDDDMDD